MVGVILIGCQGPVLGSGNTDSTVDILRFGLCSANVSQVDVSGTGSHGLPVIVVTLTADGRTELYDLTCKYAGRELDVVFDGVSLTRARIQTSIDSGIVVSREWRSVAAASAFAALIRDEAIDAPCGRLSEVKPIAPGFGQGSKKEPSD
jgi:preprotein translocase subunit SecD